MTNSSEYMPQQGFLIRTYGYVVVPEQISANRELKPKEAGHEDDIS